MNFKPFSALRPPDQFAKQVAALPYDVVSSEEARKLTQGNPLSFLRIERSEITLPKDVDCYSNAVYEQAKFNLAKFQEEHFLEMDTGSFFYIYSIEMSGRVQSGIVGLSSVDDYDSGKVKKHENTRADKELDRIKHIDSCSANTGPILMMYKNREDLSQLVKKWKIENKPVSAFEAEDNVKHTIWKIDNDIVISLISAIFSKISASYIADGHHRAAAASKVAASRKSNGIADTSDGFLSVIFPDDELLILDYNRLVSSFGTHSKAGFLEQVKKEFIVCESITAVRPRKKGEFGLYVSGQWYLLTQVQIETFLNDPVRTLDVSVVQEKILQKIIGIESPRTDNRLDFVGGIRGLEELEKRVDSGEMCFAISLYPTEIRDLISVADAGMVMPPKSTWFEPKLRSGLFVHKFTQ